MCVCVCVCVCVSHNTSVIPCPQVVPLVDSISTAKARGQVEKWLLELEGMMVASLHQVMCRTVCRQWVVCDVCCGCVCTDREASHGGILV